MPPHPDSQGYSTKDVGMALGQPQDWVTGTISIQSGVMQVWQMSLVRVTVAQSVFRPEEEDEVVAVMVTVTPDGSESVLVTCFETVDVGVDSQFTAPLGV